ncbi:hypothetical protein [Senimuribacter intestinalis]|uniref:hypothetical protein n=1 Tax=Senimuribacter intestinalis TaxID=2941507 RepID=UPI00203BFAB0|nr:hypothetical protein [Senimuribacter intestinalis]
MKRILKITAIIAITAVITYLITMNSLIIETDGNGDSAFVESFGIKWFMGINGFEV